MMITKAILVAAMAVTGLALVGATVSARSASIYGLQQLPKKARRRRK